MDADVETREQVRRLLLDRGFARVGFTGAEPVADHASAWVAAGLHASMGWMARDTAARADPQALLPGARSVVCVAAGYPATDGRGPVAGYARGEDYHRTLKSALREAVTGMEALLPGLRSRICVDTAPLLERALAARAGLGWIGRNTLLLDERHGPWLLLGEILLDVRFPPDAPAVDRCGTCTACLVACPTQALDAARHLDARRCLSYWSIEHRGEIPEPWATALGGRAFGCDDCLTACPFPARPAPERLAPARPASERPAPAPAEAGCVSPAAPFQPRPDLAAPALDELQARAEASFRRHFGSTPIERARRSGLLRNVALARRNTQARSAEDPLPESAAATGAGAPPAGEG
jgi:epoxyqueuosine reductase